MSMTRDRRIKTARASVPNGSISSSPKLDELCRRLEDLRFRFKAQSSRHASWISLRFYVSIVSCKASESYLQLLECLCVRTTWPLRCF